MVLGTLPANPGCAESGVLQVRSSPLFSLTFVVGNPPVAKEVSEPNHSSRVLQADSRE